jgi:hypothetical protein
MSKNRSTEEESKVGTMEDLTIGEKDDKDQANQSTNYNNSNTNEEKEAEMSLEERMNWLRERVRDYLTCFSATFIDSIRTYSIYISPSFSCHIYRLRVF